MVYIAYGVKLQCINIADMANSALPLIPTGGELI